MTNLTVFNKPDLDTVTACYLLGGQTERMMVVGSAPECLLADVHVLCLECGGSGRTAEMDFDHHGDIVLPCAAEQAWIAVGCPSQFKSLVRYVSAVDTGCTIEVGALPLSAVFSGMLLCVGDARERLVAGLDLLRVTGGYPPEDVSGCLDPKILEYVSAKLAATRRLEALVPQIRNYAAGPWKVFFLFSREPGVHGLLHRMGADVSVAGGLEGRYSVSVRSGLESVLNGIRDALSMTDPGWGGPAGGTIIGSPRSGSRLTQDAIISRIVGVLDAAAHGQEGILALPAGFR